ncbi:phospholipase A1 member A isoform X3 [Chelonia mydas]|uniref:phospholipase A1 member A isoform X3 n=1 Tax=Chelonia mydas TaxID=8469 RepID=UPI001CA992B1|nr:phospholipase A1 member A isoform X3 [Chelonia mydas]
MGRLSRKKAEDPRKKSVFVLAIVLVLSSACAGHETYVPAQPCSDFQTASFLQGRKLKVQFLLFTSSNPSCGQLISLGDDIKNSNFNTSLDTKIIIHGFRALGTKPSWINGLIGALFRAAKVNVVAVDWVYGATRNYPGAVENVMELSIEISRFISKLLVLGVSRTSVHFIGVSLGAHVAGLVGQFYGGQLGRITGLDPAGPKYTKASREERLDPGDALFVEAIHTDTDSNLVSILFSLLLLPTLPSSLMPRNMHLKAAGSMNGQQVRWRNTEKAFGGTSSHSSWFCQEKIVSAETISPVPSTLGRREGSLSLSMQPEGLTIYCHESFPGTFCKDWGARPSVLTLCPLWSLHTAPKMPLEISIQYSPSLPLLNCYAMLMGSDTPSDSCEYVGPHCSYFH